MLVYGRRSERNRTSSEVSIPPPGARSVIMEANASHDQACQSYRLKYDLLPLRQKFSENHFLAQGRGETP